MKANLILKMIAGVLSVNLAILWVPVPFQSEAGAQAKTSSFFTSFEKGDPALTWKNTAETSAKGSVLTSGITGSTGGPGPEKTMRTFIGRGPDHLLAGKKNAGWTGSRALTYSGRIIGRNGGSAYNKIYKVNLPVTPDMQLSYDVAPLSEDNKKGSVVSNYVSIDLAFSDGTYLHQIKRAVDHDGVRMTPSAQGQSGTLFVDQWNHKIVDIGKAAAGKKITRILVAFSSPQSGMTFHGVIDDIRISGKTRSDGSSPVDQVNILRGTNSNEAFSRGGTIPAVAVPNGFAFWSPAIDSSSARQLYPYSDNNDPKNLPEIQSFSLSHAPNVQDNDRQAFQVMPSDFIGTPGANRLNRGLAFDRKNEMAKPYYYGVTFTNGIKAEMAPASHSAVFRFTFKGAMGSLIFDNLDNKGSLTLNPDARSLEGYSDVTNNLTGETNRLFIYAICDRPIVHSSPLSGQGRDEVTAFYQFDTSGKKTVTMRAAVSLISTKQAKKNLSLEIGGKKTFNQVKQKARQAWNKKLGKITVEGASDTRRSTLYSNLYRLFLYPNEAFENTGSARKPDDRFASLAEQLPADNTDTETGAAIRKGRPYVNSRFEYSAQTVWPAYSLLDPELTGRLINGFLQNDKYSGWLPRSDTGTYADLAFSDALIRGVPGINGRQLYQSVLKDASVNSLLNLEGRPQLDDYIFKGATNTDLNQSIDWTQANSINDFALGNLASFLLQNNNHQQNKAKFSYSDDSSYFLQRSQYYLNLFNRSAGAFTGKTANGHWAKSGKKFASGSWSGTQLSLEDWNQSFNVPHDVQGLANLYGGRHSLSRRLDQYFKADAVPLIAKQGKVREAAAGGLGMFTLDNPTSPFIPYMYDFTGTPWKTQQTVRNIMNRFYVGGDIGQGYLGNDTGAMLSGWYIFSAAGIYPLAGSGNYVIGAPYFKKMTIHLENGYNLVISAPNISDKNRYIQNVTFNGRHYAKTTIPNKLLSQGGNLTFRMGPEPSAWGTSTGDLPDSVTPLSTDGSTFYPEPLSDLTNDSSSQKQFELTTGSGTTGDALIDNQSATSAVFRSGRSSIEVKFSSKNQRVKMYTLTSRDGSGRASDPKSWTLYGSGNGKSWVELDRRSNESFAWHSMTRAFAISNPRAYRYYKLEITEKSGHNPLELAEYQLLGYSGIGEGFNQLHSQVVQEFETNHLTESQTASLAHMLTQAQSSYNDGNLSAAIYYMQTFVQQTYSIASDATGSLKARNRLLADAHAIVNLLSD
ncbi:alpha-1,2-mannosidase [Sporolactobacillus sp. THM7-4]|nr:alpha-1,2-mannosidase [Sporolactobacillus sp. THM7-4]